MRDGRVGVLGTGGGIKNTVTIDTDRHGESLKILRSYVLRYSEHRILIPKIQLRTIQRCGVPSGRAAL